MISRSCRLALVALVELLCGCGGGGGGGGGGQADLPPGNCDLCNLPDAPIDPYPGPGAKGVAANDGEIPADWLHWPVQRGIPFKVSLGYDQTTHVGPFRYAVDFKHATGQPSQTRFRGVLAAADGIVSFAGSGGFYDPLELYGKRVEIDHQNGWGTRYAHLDSISVTVGTPVTKHMIVGLIGSSGAPDEFYQYIPGNPNFPGNPHLHFEVRPVGALGATHLPEPIDGVTGLFTGMEFVHGPINGRIAFESDRNGSDEIFTMNANGSNVVRLTNHLASDVQPSWSNNGTRIAFCSTRDANFQIYAMNANGTSVTRLTNNLMNDFAPTWSPDSSKIAFESNRVGPWQIYVMNADGTNQLRLSNNSSNEGSPAWSPDGTRIVFTSFRHGDPEIYSMNVDGSEQTRLTNVSGFERNPTWSPDGSQIAFISGRDGTWEIYTMNGDGTNQTRLTNNTSFEDEPVWSPDGSRIAFRSDRDGNFEIYVMDADGSNHTNITQSSSRDEHPSWGPKP